LTLYRSLINTMAHLATHKEQGQVETFVLRISLPTSKDKRVEIRISFPDQGSLNHLMNCLESDAFGAEQRARGVELASKPVVQVSDETSKVETPEAPEDEDDTTRHRRQTLEILEGAREQPKWRDYPATGRFRKAFDLYALQERHLSQRNAQNKEHIPAQDKGPVFTWASFHRWLTNLLTLTSGVRLPPCRPELKPIILRLDPRKGESSPFVRVQHARSAEGASMDLWRTLMKNVDQHGWQNYVLWLTDPEQDIPSQIKRNPDDVMSVTMPDNLV
jgi:hypothetical protein